MIMILNIIYVINDNCSQSYCQLFFGKYVVPFERL